MLSPLQYQGPSSALLRLDDNPIVCNIYYLNPLARLSEANCNMALQLVSGAYQGKAELAYLCRANGRHVGAHIFGPKLKDTSQISESVKRLFCLTPVNADV